MLHTRISFFPAKDARGLLNGQNRRQHPDGQIRAGRFEKVQYIGPEEE